MLFCVSGCAKKPRPAHERPKVATPEKPAAADTGETPRLVPAPLDPQASPRPKKPRPKLDAEVSRKAKEARNKPAIALYVAERLDWVDKIVTLRVHAEKGDYFNCYYKGKQAAYHHVRLRGDGSLYLDGYLPRDKAGELLWAKLVQKKSMKLTVKTVMRPGTMAGVCVGQVEILDHERGWDFQRGGVSEGGALARRISNSKDKTPARNHPSIRTFMESRGRVVGRKLTVKVHTRLARPHQCSYRDTERTHYALQLQGDSFKGLRGYVKRDTAGRKLARMLAGNEGARMTVEVTVPEGRYDEMCPDQVEVIGWKLGW